MCLVLLHSSTLVKRGQFQKTLGNIYSILHFGVSGASLPAEPQVLENQELKWLLSFQTAPKPVHELGKGLFPDPERRIVIQLKS